MPLAELLPKYRELGFNKFEGFSRWAEARFDYTQDPLQVRKALADHGFTLTSFHLPPITEDIEASLKEALVAARFAAQIGDGVVVLYKAAFKELFGRSARRFLDAMEAEKLNLTPVLQNHFGSAISTLEDYREVLADINDPRMKAVLEVGHFQRAGIHWRDGWELLGDGIGLIHVNEIRDGRSVHFGTGEVDFTGLMKHVRNSRFTGNIVVELELENHATSPDETLNGLKQAVTYLNSCYEQP
jgi:sugar phosphate isomerase/epimerase